MNKVCKLLDFLLKFTLSSVDICSLLFIKRVFTSLLRCGILKGKDYKTNCSIYILHIVAVSPFTGEISEGQWGVRLLFVL
jgi:hypothetical protein